jgi:hypothetical protein
MDYILRDFWFSEARKFFFLNIYTKKLFQSNMAALYIEQIFLALEEEYRWVNWME